MIMAQKPTNKELEQQVTELHMKNDALLKTQTDGWRVIVTGVGGLWTPGNEVVVSPSLMPKRLDGFTRPSPGRTPCN